MRKHPLLAFATKLTSLGLAVGLVPGTVLAENVRTAHDLVGAKSTTLRKIQIRVIGATALTSPLLAPSAVPLSFASNAAVRPFVVHGTTTPQKATPQKATLQRATTAPAGGLWQALRVCESGGDYRMDSGNGYYGAYQFAPETWRSLGYGGLPNVASPAVQDAAAAHLARVSGWQAWPTCSQRLGL